MKGLSPLVAAIILIAFAVAVGSLISFWLTSFATTTTDFTSEQGTKLTECAGVRLRIDTVTESSIVFSNPSVKTVTDIVLFDDKGRNLELNATTLNQGQIGNLSWSREGSTSLLIRGICEGSVVVQGACEEGQPCWK